MSAILIMSSLVGDWVVACQQSAGGSDTSSTASTDCLVCAFTVQRKACALSSATCTGAVRMSCLIDQCKQTDFTLAQSRNSLEWLKGLLLFTGLKYTGQSCRSGNFPKSTCNGNSVKQPRTPSAATEELKAQVISINHKLEQLCNRIHSDDVTEFSYSPSAVYTSRKSGAVTNPPSYAAVVSNDLSTVVQSAVIQSPREQKAVDRNQSYIAIHGMRKYGCDLSDVQELCRYLECKALVIDWSFLQISK